MARTIGASVPEVKGGAADEHQKGDKYSNRTA
jgi:hypothetical protein